MTEPSRDPRQSLQAEVVEAIRGLQADHDLLEQAVADRLAVNRTDARFIALLSQTHGMTAGHLAVACRLTSGAATTAIDRLQRAGYVRRVRDDVDRRRVMVQLTDHGRRLDASVRGPLAEGHAALLADCDDGELRRLRDLLRQARALCAHQVEHVRSGAGAPDAGR